MLATDRLQLRTAVIFLLLSACEVRTAIAPDRVPGTSSLSARQVGALSACIRNGSNPTGVARSDLNDRDFQQYVVCELNRFWGHCPRGSGTAYRREEPVDPATGARDPEHGTNFDVENVAFYSVGAFVISINADARVTRRYLSSGPPDFPTTSMSVCSSGFPGFYCSSGFPGFYPAFGSGDDENALHDLVFDLCRRRESCRADPVCRRSLR